MLANAPGAERHTVSRGILPLIRAGAIRILISERNYRTIEILTGEHVGKTTKPPTKPPWKIIDANGPRVIRLKRPPKKRKRWLRLASCHLAFGTPLCVSQLSRLLVGVALSGFRACKE